jgi:hypothetical protein
MHTQTQTNTHAHSHVGLYLYIYIPANTYMQTNTHTQNAQLYIYSHTHTHVYINIHTHTKQINRAARQVANAVHDKASESELHSRKGSRRRVYLSQDQVKWPGAKREMNIKDQVVPQMRNRCVFYV